MKNYQVVLCGTRTVSIQYPVRCFDRKQMNLKEYNFVVMKKIIISKVNFELIREMNIPSTCTIIHIPKKSVCLKCLFQIKKNKQSNLEFLFHAKISVVQYYFKIDEATFR